MHDIAIIIPAYNEELTIRETMSEFHRQVPEAALFVIDNNSKDKTNSVARETLTVLGCEGKVLFERRQGKGNAIRRAFCEIDARVYVMVDADLTYPPSDLPRLLGPILLGEADMVIGDRLSRGHYARENKRAFHGFGNNLVRSMINYLFKSNLDDIMTGFRVFNRKFVKNFPILSEGFELETEMTLHALDKRFRIIEVPVSYKDRPTGSFSKLNTFADGLRVIRTIFQIFKDYRPFEFFSFCSLFFFLAGILIGMPVVFEFLETRYVSRVPSAILASGCMVFSVILFSVGLFLDTVVRLHKLNYELRLYDWTAKSTDDKG